MDTVESMQDFTQAFVIATISAMPENGPNEKSIVLGDVTSWTDYAFIGDIVKLIFTDNVDNDDEPYINISGTVVDSDKNQSSFDLRPSQYCQLLHGNSEFPAHFTIPDSKRWSKNKPVPAIGCPISVGGFLHRVTRSTNENTIAFFDIDVVNVSYITDRNQTRHTKSVDQANTASTSSRTRFDYRAHKQTPKRKPQQDPDEQKMDVKHRKTTPTELEDDQTLQENTSPKPSD